MKKLVFIPMILMLMYNQDVFAANNSITFLDPQPERNPQLEEAFSKVFDLKRGVDQVRYYYNQVDLNDDALPETIVYLEGPTVCGTGGCSALIFQRKDGRYMLHSRFSVVRTPMVISEKKTKGWRNIILPVYGGGIEPADKELKFNGVSYPLNPTVQPDVESGAITGIGLFSDEAIKQGGIDF